MRRPFAPLLVIAGAGLLWALLATGWIASLPDISVLDRDEGLNLIKASMVNAGYTLYRDVWSDQPPVFTKMLAGWTRAFGDTVGAARTLTALHAGVLVALLGYLSWRLSGRRLRAAVVTMLLVIGAARMGKLSAAVMIGLPAMTWALAAICVVAAMLRTRAWWLGLLAAGAMFGVSLQIKLFTFIALPFAAAVAVWVWREGRRYHVASTAASPALAGASSAGAAVAATRVPGSATDVLPRPDPLAGEEGIGVEAARATVVREPPHPSPLPRGEGTDAAAIGAAVMGVPPHPNPLPKGERAGAALVRCAVGVVLFAAALVGMCYLVGPFREAGWREQLVSPHVGGHAKNDETTLQSLQSIVEQWGDDAPVMAAALLAAIAAGRGGWRGYWPAVVWFGSSVVALSQANPVWSHHRVLMSWPAAVIAGVAAAELWDRNFDGFPFRTAPKNWKLQLAALGLIAIACVWGVGLRAWDAATIARGPKDDRLNAELVAQIRARSKPGEWLFTDDPHYAYVAHLKVPPEIAVWSNKRERRGEIPLPTLVEIRDRYEVPLMLLARHKRLRVPETRKALTSGYLKVFDSPYADLYDRRAAQ